MSGGDKILSSIREECEQNVRKIRALAEEERTAALERAQADAKVLLENARAQAAERAEASKKAAQSRTELEKRNAILRERRSQIDRTVTAVEETMLSLDDGAYFDLLCSMSSGLREKSGEIIFNSKDLARVPSDFLSRLREKGVQATISSKPDDRIRGGFILKNGDIEDNMSFGAVIADRRDALEDLIGRMLFED